MLEAFAYFGELNAVSALLRLKNTADQLVARTNNVEGVLSSEGHK